jgi:hypothetical protein
MKTIYLKLCTVCTIFQFYFDLKLLQIFQLVFGIGFLNERFKEFFEKSNAHYGL